MVSASNFTLLNGSLHVEERLGDFRFRISPSSFFQVNIPATIELYDLIKSLASTPNAILLDLCCGTGTIGIYLAHAFERVIGIECVEEAVEDAKYNASLNNITNIEFHAAKLEDCLNAILEGIPEIKGNRGRPGSSTCWCPQVRDQDDQGMHQDQQTGVRFMCS